MVSITIWVSLSRTILLCETGYSDFWRTKRSKKGRNVYFYESQKTQGNVIEGDLSPVTKVEVLWTFQIKHHKYSIK